jgi:predicted AlkP superfamily pyrophosphatase or phosphodiesterase
MRSKYLVFVLLLSVIVVSCNVAIAGRSKPKLILQVTVDQLRGDQPERYLDRMGKGGFRYLLEEGVVYKDAHHRHSNTETVVGHATLATGADPAVHGMVGNVWFDRDQKKLVYNIEDSRYPILTAGADVNE